VRARTGMEYPKPTPAIVTEADLRGMVEGLAALHERELTGPEVTLVLNCCAILRDLLTPEEGRPYPNEHACRLQPPSKFSEFRRGTRKHEGKTYSIIFGHVKDTEDWEEQAYRYAKDVWEAAEARAHCKSHDGSFEAASGQDAIACALSDMPSDAPSIQPSAALITLQNELAALASRGPIRSPSGTGRIPSIAPDIHALLTDLRSLGARL